MPFPIQHYLQCLDFDTQQSYFHCFLILFYEMNTQNRNLTYTVLTSPQMNILVS